MIWQQPKLCKESTIKIDTVIFDLDGTLVDSADPILRSILFAFNEVRIPLTTTLTSDLIGPPLVDIVKSLLPNEHQDATEHIISIFRRCYDEQSYINTKAYDGITQALEKLRKQDLILYVATNKASIPTIKIIKLFGWEHLFTEVYSLNTFTPPMPTKSDLLKAICVNHEITPSTILYVGDRPEDKQAASETGTRFAMAQWGYSPQKLIGDDTIIVSTPDQLAKTINRHFQ